MLFTKQYTAHHAADLSVTSGTFHLRQNRVRSAARFEGQGLTAWPQVHMRASEKGGTKGIEIPGDTNLTKKHPVLKPFLHA